MLNIAIVDKCASFFSVYDGICMTDQLLFILVLTFLKKK